MIRKETHKLRGALRGSVEKSMTSGFGTPCADPRLPIVMVEGYAPDGLDVVSNVGIAVGINDKGFLQPCDGTVVPYGIIAHALLGTACMWEDAVPGNFEIFPTQTNGAITGTEALHQLTPTVYQATILFDRGLAYKKTGVSKAIFEYGIGDILRPIAKAEIDAAIADDTLPVLAKLFKGETKANCPKTKAYYAGTLVKFGATITETPEGANDPKMACARAAQFRNPNSYRNYAYKGHWQFDYDLQGKSTEGNARHIFDMIADVIDNAEYEVKISEFYVNM